MTDTNATNAIVVSGASTLWLHGTYTIGSRITLPAGQSITYNGSWSTTTLIVAGARPA